MYRKATGKGFVLLEAMATCALVMFTWYVITQCAVQAIALEAQVEKKAKALIAANSTIEKLKSGLLLLKNQTITDNGMEIVVSCEQKLYAELLQIVMVKVFIDGLESVCLKTAILQQ
ncbi:MAG: hypothetical protein K2X90_03540 [Candidatus Babeliaceae bacterium]|nr:hypothetical protein [Candidatus Babeliaceae bacterium]